MASERVTIRQPATGQERSAAKSAVDAGFFPGWEVVDKSGRKSSHQPANARQES